MFTVEVTMTEAGPAIPIPVELGFKAGDRLALLPSGPGLKFVPVDDALSEELCVSRGVEERWAQVLRRLAR